MIRILIVLALLTSSVFGEENNCSYETKTISKNGQVVETIEIKTCKETIELGNKNIIHSFLTEKKYENSLILFTMFLMENVL